jgi:hypothetical protein
MRGFRCQSLSRNARLLAAEAVLSLVEKFFGAQNHEYRTSQS